MGPLSHIELLFSYFYATGDYLICDVEDHQTIIEIEGGAIKDHQSKIEIKGVSARDHQTIIGVTTTAIKDHQIILDIWGTEEHVH